MSITEAKVLLAGGGAVICDAIAIVDVWIIRGPLELRVARIAEGLHRLGPRPLAEYIWELYREHGNRVIEIAEPFAALDISTLRAIGADQFAPQIFAVEKEESKE